VCVDDDFIMCREITQREATYEQLGGKLPHAKSKLNDPNFMIPLVPLRRQRLDKFELKKPVVEQTTNDNNVNNGDDDDGDEKKKEVVAPAVDANDDAVVVDDDEKKN
jgi:hypothetical protein